MYTATDYAILNAYGIITESCKQPKNVSEAEWKVEKPIEDFDAWGSAEDVLKRVIEEGKEDELEELCSEVFSGKVPTETELNDWLRFDSDWIYEHLGISDDEETDDGEDGEDLDECDQTADVSEDFDKMPRDEYDQKHEKIDSLKQKHCFNIEYDGGEATKFLKSSYARIVARTKEEAVEKLQDILNGWEIKILNVEDEGEQSDYEDFD